MVQACTLQIHHSAFFFIHSKEILFQVSKLNLHKQQGKQTRDGKKKKKIFLEIPNSRQEITNGKA